MQADGAAHKRGTVTKGAELSIAVTELKSHLTNRRRIM